MAHARGLVGVRPLFAMRVSLVHGPRPPSKDRELTMDCPTGHGVRRAFLTAVGAHRHVGSGSILNVIRRYCASGPEHAGSVSASVLPRSTARTIAVASVTAVTPMYTRAAILGILGSES